MGDGTFAETRGNAENAPDSAGRKIATESPRFDPLPTRVRGPASTLNRRRQSRTFAIQGFHTTGCGARVQRVNSGANAGVSSSAILGTLYRTRGTDQSLAPIERTEQTPLCEVMIEIFQTMHTAA
jgi:hypothetical protein